MCGTVLSLHCALTALSIVRAWSISCPIGDNSSCTRVEGQHVLLQRGFHRDVSVNARHAYDVEHAMHVDQTPQQGLLKFWCIALVSYFVSALFTFGVWCWFDKKHATHVHKDTGEDTDDDGSRSVTSRRSATPSSRASKTSRTSRVVSRASQATGTNRTPDDEATKQDIRLWRVETYNERLQGGALTLLTLACTMGIYALLRFVHRPPCAPPFTPLVHGPEIAVLLGMVALTASCWVFPRNYLFWPAFGIFLLYIPAVALPPFNLSCETLETTCKSSQHWRITSAVNHVDCSLQGQTAQQIFMTVILLLPWLLPDMKQLHVMWVWLVSVYVVWSVAYFRYSSDAGLPGAIPFGPMDIMTRLILMSCTLVTSLTKKYYVQKSQQYHFSCEKATKEESKKLYTILEYMLPEHVIEPMLCKEDVAASIDIVTILFIVIDDFDAIVKEKSPESLLRFLNKQFTDFDNICKQNGVTKIETVGEEYVCCVGVSPADIQDTQTRGHAEVVGRIFKAANAILQLQTETVKFKMGMHTGPVVAGCPARKLPRYRLFGDTINTAARMMQKGEVGQLQFGEATHKHLPGDVHAKYRGKIEMKGKGQVETYLFGPSVPSKRHAMRYDDGSSDAPPRLGGLMHRCRRLLDEQHESDTEDDDVSDVGSASQNSAGNNKFKAIVAMVEERTNKARKFNGEWRFLSERNEFNPEMEEEWQQSFHVDYICKKIDYRLDVQFLGLLIVTIIELFWNFSSPQEPDSGWARAHENFGVWPRLPIFIVSRAVGLTIIAWVRYLTYSGDWFLQNAAKFQSCLIVSQCAVALLVFLSYDVLITGMGPTTTQNRVLAPTDQIFSLLFVLLFCFIIRGHNVLFFNSLVFIPLAIIIVAASNFRTRSGVYFPAIGQVLFVVIAISYSILAHSEEQGLRARFRAALAVRSTKERVKAILETMMPPLVLEEVSKFPAGQLAHHQYEAATIAQSDLCGFTKLASSRTPLEVVQFIGELFGMFDKLTDKFGIYKVETVGDAYIAGKAEPPLTQDNSPTSVIEFGMAMIGEVEKWSASHSLEVRCRVGVHHGEVIGGIVDKEMQRYHMFGKLMQVIEILESTAPEACVQVSRACHDAVMRERSDRFASKSPAHVHFKTSTFEFKERSEEHLVTSKGDKHHYEETGGRTFLVMPPTSSIFGRESESIEV